MERDLTELSKDYFKAAEDISCLIAKYRKLLNEAYEANNHLKTYEIKRKLTDSRNRQIKGNMQIT